MIGHDVLYQPRDVANILFCLEFYMLLLFHNVQVGHVHEQENPIFAEDQLQLVRVIHHYFS